MTQNLHSSLYPWPFQCDFQFLPSKDGGFSLIYGSGLAWCRERGRGYTVPFPSLDLKRSRKEHHLSEHCHYHVFKARLASGDERNEGSSQGEELSELQQPWTNQPSTNPAEDHSHMISSEKPTGRAQPKLLIWRQMS